LLGTGSLIAVGNGVDDTVCRGGVGEEGVELL
jgi:hypothetical protein